MYMNVHNYNLKARLDLTDKPDSFCWLDTPIAPAISELNRHGFKTAFCCSGHFDEQRSPSIAYIQFAFGCITPEHLPSGWRYESDGQMEYVFSADSSTDFEEELEKTMSDLFSWAQRLPQV